MAGITKVQSETLSFLFVLQIIVLISQTIESTYFPDNSPERETFRTKRNTEVDRVERVIYDVTGIWEYGDISSLALKKASSLMYSKADGTTCLSRNLGDGNIMENVIRSARCESSVGHTSLSFLFSLDQYPRLNKVNNCPVPIDNLKEDRNSLIHSLIISVNRFSHLNCLCFSRTLSDHLVHQLKIIERKSITFVKLGIEYPEQLIDSCATGDFTTLRRADLAVLRIEISAFTNLLSFGMFSKRLDDLVWKNRGFVRSLNPTCTIHIRLVIQHFQNLTDHVNHRYRDLVFEYFKAWKEEYKGDEIFIISGFSQDAPFLLDNFEYLKTRASPTVRFSDADAMNSVTSDLRETPPFFRNIEVDVFFKGEEIFTRNLNRPSKVNSPLDQLSFHTKANLSLVLNQFGPSADGPRLLKMAIDKVHRLNNIHTIYFGKWRTSWTATELHSTSYLLEFKYGIQIGCYMEIDWKDFSKDNTSFIEKIKSDCGPLLNVSSKILYYIRYGGASRNIVDFLWDLEKAQEIIRTAFPAILEAIPRIRNIPSKPKTLTHSTETLYCDERKLLTNEYYQGIVTFAIVHGWPHVHLRHLIGDHFQGWWRNIVINEHVNRTNANFTVLVRTNAAKPINKYAKLPNTFDCVEWTEKAPKDGIEFLANKYSGTAVSMDLRETLMLSKGELETLMRFTLGKFSTVELVARSEEDVATVKEVITDSFLEMVYAFNEQSLGSNLVYLEVPIEFALNPRNPVFALKHVAVHFIGWEKFHHPHQKNFEHFASGNFGLTVADCANEVNLKLERLFNLQFLPNLKYIVCDLKPVRPSNYDVVWMNKFLNTLFYIKSYMERFIPQWRENGTGDKLEVSFRINLISEGNCGFGKPQTKNFLTFLNDVNQQSKAYKIRYFIVNAFGNEDLDQECLVSWWTIGNYTNLSNISVFTDREEEHFGRETELKIIPLNFNKDKSHKTYMGFVVIVSGISVFLFISVLVLWLNHSRLRKAYLTQKEVNDFFHGMKVATKSDDYQGEGYCKWLGMEFPKSFQIAKKNIELGRLVGSGQFGEVFIGKLNQEIEIAIKIPRPNASRDVFKGALAEVKILCFVGDGSHPNVITFMGAYTKEIADGKLYMLTEYCHNGSLLDYLRASQVEIDGGGDVPNSSVDQYDMYRLAFEIASGMEYIGGKWVIHGDLSTRNVFLDSNYTCKIGDFGLSRKLYEYTKYVKTSQDPLPWKWMAIESLKNLEFTTKSDVWSYGITVWEIFSMGSQPYPGLAWTPDFVNELEKGMRLSKAKYASDVIHDTLLACWSPAQESRPSFAELAKYFAGMRNDAYTDFFEVEAGS